MVGIGPCPDAYEDCVIVKKLKDGARDAFIFDKNFTIQRFSQPVANPPQSEIAAGLRIRRRTQKYPMIFGPDARALDRQQNVRQVGGVRV